MIVLFGSVVTISVILATITVAFFDDTQHKENGEDI